MISLFRYIIGAILTVLTQVLIFSRIEPGYGTYVMIYPLFLMVIPFRIKTINLLFISFFLGLSIDYFMNTYGLHAASLTFAAYIRPMLFNVIAPNEEYVRGDDSGKYTNKFRFFIILFLLILIHHVWFFIIESFNLGEFFFTLIRIGLSTMISTIIAFIIFLLFLVKTNIED
jgi:hypothetical protein